MKTPKKITPAPIIEAVTEIRFDSDLPSAVLFGKLYDALSSDFSEYEQLPILEMPQHIIEKQPELRFAPHYRLKNDRFIVNVGQRVVSVNRLCTEVPYKDWLEYLDCIKTVMGKLGGFGIIETAKKVTVRYINFLDKQVQEVLNLKIDLFSGEVDDYKSLNMALTKDLGEDQTLSFTIASDAKVEIGDQTKEGLAIHVQASKDSETGMDGVNDAVEALHLLVEKAFFDSLKPEFLATLNPEYEQ